MGAVTILVAVLVVLVALVVTRWIIAYLRFRRLELAIPGPPSLPLLGNALSLLGATEDDVLDRVLELWGGRTELSRITVGPILMLLATDPDDIEKVLRSKETQEKAIHYRFIDFFSRNGIVTAKGPVWKTHRKVIQPALHSNVLESTRFQEIFSDECQSFCSRIKEGVSQDVIASLQTVTGRSAIRTQLGETVGTTEEVDVVLRVYSAVNDLGARSVVQRGLCPWLWPDALFRLSSAGKALLASVDNFDRVARPLIARHRALRKQKKATLEDHEGRSLLDALVEGADDGLLTDDDVIEELKIILSGASETTVSALGWILKVLSLRQDIQDRILEEVKMVLGDDDDFTKDNVERLDYTERVIKEALRLVPAAVIMGRNVSTKFVLNGKTIPKDSLININIFGAHRDPRHWEEPLKFDPDRFLPERSVGRHRYAFLPFSAGPKGCPGGRYSMRLMKTFLATVVSEYRIDLVDDGHTDPSKFPMSTRIGTFMPGGIHVVFNKRPTFCREKP